MAPHAPDERIIKRASGLAWRPTDMAGVDWKPLRYVAETGAGAALLRMAPGCAYPAHRHERGEDVYVLEGELLVGDDRLGPGDYLHSPPGSIHAPRTTQGCVILATYPGHVRDL